MKKALSILVLCLASTPAFAIVPIDGMRNEIACHVKGMVDGGYDVLISDGGFAPHTEALLSETYFTGKQTVLGKWVVTVSRKGDETIYADMETSGDTFKLTMNGTPPIGAPVDAKLDTNDKAGRNSAEMSCMRLVQNMAQPVRAAVNPKPVIPAPVLKTLVQCDGGEETQLAIRQVTTGIARTMRADLTVQSVGDSYPTFHYMVQESAQKPGMMGGSTQFTGNGFELTINTDGPMGPKGFRSVLKVESPKTSQTLSCKITG